MNIPKPNKNQKIFKKNKILLVVVWVKILNFNTLIMKSSSATTVNEITEALENFGDEQTKKTLMLNGAQEPFFGVKVADLKNTPKDKKEP